MFYTIEISFINIHVLHDQEKVVFTLDTIDLSLHELRLCFRSVLFIDNEEFSQVNSNYQRNGERNSINLVCHVDKTISVLTYKIGYFAGSRRRGFPHLQIYSERQQH